MKNLNNKLENRLNRKIVDKLYVQITKNQDSQLSGELYVQLYRQILDWQLCNQLGNLLDWQLINQMEDGKS
jgi:hypothetical protein